VFAQTRQPEEIIVVDDNGEEPDLRRRTSGVVEAVRGEVPEGTALSYLTPAHNLGGAGARNHGAARAGGGYIAFLDDDDWWLPEKLERQLAVFRSGEDSGRASARPGLVYTSRRIVGPDGETKRVRTATHRGWIAQVLIAENVIGTTSCAMVPREVFEAVEGFDERLPSRQDIDLWLRIAADHFVDYVETPLTVQQEHAEGRISRRFDAKARGLEMFLKKYYPAIARRPEVLAAHCMRIGTHYLKYGRPLRGRRWMIGALIARPSAQAFRRLLFGVAARKDGGGESS
jgi:GT2 family glycosyltransferase